MPNVWEEIEDLAVFLAAYERATGERLIEERIGDAPDAVCRRVDGRVIGIELTQIRRSPRSVVEESIFDRRGEMDVGEALEELERVLEKKREALKNYSQRENILVIASRDTDFRVLVRMAREMPIGELETIGFDEIWLADFQGITQSAHREAVLFGLFPERWRMMFERSIFDQKPYG